MAKTTCPVTRADFREKAKPLELSIGGRTLTAMVKEFSTGSFGWYINDKVPVEIDGKTVMVQVGCNMTIVGSKEAAE